MELFVRGVIREELSQYSRSLSVKQPVIELGTGSLTFTASATSAILDITLPGPPAIVIPVSNSPGFSIAADNIGGNIGRFVGQKIDGIAVTLNLQFDYLAIYPSSM